MPEKEKACLEDKNRKRQAHFGTEEIENWLTSSIP
jgi:hypothetical protein